MISTWTPERVNENLSWVRLAKVGKKKYFGRDEGYNILCYCRHPREAFLSHQSFNQAGDWESILITRKGEVILNIYRDRLK
jgi:hypothetical protein